jgi:predicted nucleic-acid-binding protein
MADHSRWRNFYNSAMHAFGNENCQEHKTHIAICACIERLWQIDLEETTEREEIYTALGDLSILKILDRKYA